MNKKRVIIGFLGTKLDLAHSRTDRWAQWRPSVGICQQQDFVADRFELIHSGRTEKLLQQVTKDIGSVSPETDVRTHAVKIRDPWDFEEVYASLHQFSSDYPFDLEREEYLAHITTGTHVAQICLFLLTESRHIPGTLLQTSPPVQRGRSRNTSLDACGTFRIIDLDLSRYDALATRFKLEQKESLSFLKSGIETRNTVFNQLIERIERVSLATTAPILLTGPTGAGKSQLASRIFQLKRHRKQVSGEMVEVNCATIRGDQSMSTLFGHVKGAFTGAVAARAGLLKAADGGVLFLDEIGELGMDEQAMLLRAIEEKQFLPVGSDETVHSDFQLLAGTNRDLQREVALGNFREDLLARINLWSFRLPGLAERREDIGPNIDFELEKFTSENGQKVTMNKEARKRFLDFSLAPSSTWKANFRDLNAAITRMATLADGGRITAEVVKEEVQRLEASWNPGENGNHLENDIDLSLILPTEKLKTLDLFDRLQLQQVFRVCREFSTISAAGRHLYQASRQNKKQPNDADRLRKYLAKFGVSWKDITNAGK